MIRFWRTAPRCLLGVLALARDATVSVESRGLIGAHADGTRLPTVDDGVID